MVRKFPRAKENRQKQKSLGTLKRFNILKVFLMRLFRNTEDYINIHIYYMEHATRVSICFISEGLSAC
jgi:hypothetical protein